jgi:serine/threonine-protein kinase
VRVYCWGSNKHLLLTIGESGIFGPTLIPALDGVKAIRLAVNAPLACAIRADDRVICWGQNYAGSLGHATAIDAGAKDTSCAENALCNRTPMPVGGATFKAKELAVGGFFGCILDPDARVWCWGNNQHGTLGRSESTDYAERPTPGLVPLVNVTQISANASHACAVVGGAPFCWGANEWGELGDALKGAQQCGADVRCRTSPSAAVLNDVVQIAASAVFTLARTSDGQVLSWGANVDGRLGHLPGESGDLASCESGGSTNRRCNPHPTPLTFP